MSCPKHEDCPLWQLDYRSEDWETVEQEEWMETQDKFLANGDGFDFDGPLYMFPGLYLNSNGG